MKKEHRIFSILEIPSLERIFLGNINSRLTEIHQDYTIYFSCSFLENIERISLIDYIPSIDDIYACKRKPYSIHEHEVEMEHWCFNLIDISDVPGESRIVLQRLDSVSLVVFCADISEYDRTLPDDDSKNALKETLLLFDEYRNSTLFKDTTFVLFFTKIDLFRCKISDGNLLTTCFEDYRGKINIRRMHIHKIYYSLQDHKLQNHV